MKQLFTLSFLLLSTCSVLIAQDIRNNPSSNHGNKFEQLGTILPTPNDYRTASGAPGPKYWQQRADYQMEIVLKDETQEVFGRETVTYTNNSPDALSYLWLQLDQNYRAHKIIYEHPGYQT